MKRRIKNVNQGKTEENILVTESALEKLMRIAEIMEDWEFRAIPLSSKKDSVIDDFYIPQQRVDAAEVTLEGRRWLDELSHMSREGLHAWGDAHGHGSIPVRFSSIDHGSIDMSGPKTSTSKEEYIRFDFKEAAISDEGNFYKIESSNILSLEILLDKSVFSDEEAARLRDNIHALMLKNTLCEVPHIVVNKSAGDICGIKRIIEFPRMYLAQEIPASMAIPAGEMQEGDGKNPLLQTLSFGAYKKEYLNFTFTSSWMESDERYRTLLLKSTTTGPLLELMLDGNAYAKEDVEKLRKGIKGRVLKSISDEEDSIITDSRDKEISSKTFKRHEIPFFYLPEELNLNSKTLAQIRRVDHPLYPYISKDNSTIKYSVDAIIEAVPAEGNQIDIEGLAGILKEKVEFPSGTRETEKPAALRSKIYAEHTPASAGLQQPEEAVCITGIASNVQESHKEEYFPPTPTAVGKLWYALNKPVSSFFDDKITQRKRASARINHKTMGRTGDSATPTKQDYSLGEMDGFYRRFEDSLRYIEPFNLSMLKLLREDVKRFNERIALPLDKREEAGALFREITSTADKIRNSMHDETMQRYDELQKHHPLFHVENEIRLMSSHLRKQYSRREECERKMLGEYYSQFKEEVGMAEGKKGRTLEALCSEAMEIKNKFYSLEKPDKAEEADKLQQAFASAYGQTRYRELKFEKLLLKQFDDLKETYKGLASNEVCDALAQTYKDIIEFRADLKHKRYDGRAEEAERMLAEIRSRYLSAGNAHLLLEQCRQLLRRYSRENLRKNQYNRHYLEEIQNEIIRIKEKVPFGPEYQATSRIADSLLKDISLKLDYSEDVYRYDRYGTDKADPGGLKTPVGGVF